MNIEGDELDVKLQRVSADLIADLNSSLRPLIWKVTAAGIYVLRSEVRERDLSRLLNMVETNSKSNYNANS